MHDSHTFSALGLLIIGSAFWGCAPVEPAGDTALGAREAPKVIVVAVVDTLRADHVGSYGYERETTPFVDGLARGGRRWANVWSAAPWTVPSVASMLTGLPVSEHGSGLVGERRSLGEDLPSLLDPALATLPGALRDAGWNTLLFSANPFLHGTFREAFEFSLVERTDAATLIASALRQLEPAPASRSAFLWVQLMDVHQPNAPPDPYFRMFGEGAERRTAKHGDWSYGQQRDLADPGFLEFRSQRIGTYDGSIRYVDDQMRALAEALWSRYGRENVAFWVTSDHGEEFWDHAAAQEERSDDERGFWGVGHGHTLYEEQLRVPLVLDWSRTESAVSTCPVSLVAFPRAVLELAQVEVPRAMAGPSLLRVGACERWLRWAEGTAYGWDRWALDRSGLKAIWSPEGLELFQLGADPAERHDLSGDRAREAESLARAGWRLRSQRAKEAARGPQMVPDEELVKELQAVGYL
jgi:arylsulfatase A-like enzyme